MAREPEPAERPISFRPDSESGRALRYLMRALGQSRTAAIRTALIETAARRRNMLSDEAAALAADPEDRAEIAEVRALMDSLRAEG